MEIVGKPIPPKGQEPVTDVRVVSHDYLKTMGIPLIKGRLFNENDPADAKDRVVINQAMAERYWPGEDPIGKQVRISWDGRTDEVIGVVGNVRHEGLDVESRAMIYWPFARNNYGTVTVAVRGKGEPQAPPLPSPASCAQLDPLLVVANVKTMDEIVSNSVAATALDDADADDLCRRRAAARRPRHLWRDRVRRHATHAGDRHPHGARCAARRCAQDGRAAGACARRGRHRHRRRRRVAVDARDGGLALSGRHERSDSLSPPSAASWRVSRWWRAIFPAGARRGSIPLWHCDPKNNGPASIRQRARLTSNFYFFTSAFSTSAFSIYFVAAARSVTAPESSLTLA